MLFDDNSLLDAEPWDDRIARLAVVQLLVRAAVDEADRAEAMRAFATLAASPVPLWAPTVGLLGELAWEPDEAAGEFVLAFPDEESAARAPAQIRRRAGLRVAPAAAAA